MLKAARSYKNAQDRLFRYLREHGMRPSKVRDMVLNAVCQLPQPFTAEQLIAACAEQYISVGTIYNALNVFVDARVLHAYKRQQGQLATEYELIAGTPNKIQIICQKCGRVQSLSEPAVSMAIKEGKYNNFNMQHFTLYIYGECKICRVKTIGRLRGGKPS